MKYSAINALDAENIHDILPAAVIRTGSRSTDKYRVINVTCKSVFYAVTCGIDAAGKIYMAIKYRIMQFVTFEY